MMKIVKNKYLVMRALKEKYNPEDALAWTATARELAKATGLNEAQVGNVGRKLAVERLAREVASQRTVKSGKSLKYQKTVGYALNRAGAVELDRMQAQLDELGLEL